MPATDWATEFTWPVAPRRDQVLTDSRARFRHRISFQAPGDVEEAIGQGIIAFFLDGSRTHARLTDTRDALVKVPTPFRKGSSSA